MEPAGTPAPVQAFDIIDEFTDDLEKNSLKNFRLTHKKTIDESASNKRRVACMDKILNDLKKNLDQKTQLTDEQEETTTYQDDVTAVMNYILETIESNTSQSCVN